MNKNEAITKCVESCAKENIALLEKGKSRESYNLKSMLEQVSFDSEPLNTKFNFIINLIRSIGGIGLIAFAIDSIRVYIMK